MDQFALAGSMHDAAPIMHQMLRDSPSLPQRTLPGPRPGLHALLQAAGVDEHALAPKRVTIRSRQGGSKQVQRRLDVDLDGIVVLTHDDDPFLHASGTEVTVSLPVPGRTLRLLDSVMQQALGVYCKQSKATLHLEGVPMQCGSDAQNRALLSVPVPAAPVAVRPLLEADVNMRAVGAPMMNELDLGQHDTAVQAYDGPFVDHSAEALLASEHEPHLATSVDTDSDAALDELADLEAKPSMSDSDGTITGQTPAGPNAHVVGSSATHLTTSNGPAVHVPSTLHPTRKVSMLLQLNTTASYSEPMTVSIRAGSTSEVANAPLVFRDDLLVDKKQLYESEPIYTYYGSSQPFPIASITCDDNYGRCKFQASMTFYVPVRSECPAGYSLTSPPTPFIGSTKDNHLLDGKCASPNIHNNTVRRVRKAMMGGVSYHTFCAFSWACAPANGPNPHDHKSSPEHTNIYVVCGSIFAALCLVGGAVAFWWRRRQRGQDVSTGSDIDGPQDAADLRKGLINAGDHAQVPQ